jgi:hypothetical protein
VRSAVRSVRLAAALLLPVAAAAAPDLAAPRSIGGMRVFPDFSRPDLYYLAPGDLEVAIDENGRPKLHFLQMRYTGTALYGNQGESGSFSTLTIGVRLHSPSEPELLLLRKSLQTLVGHLVELRPLPITAFEAAVVYAPIGEPASERSAGEKGYFESDDRNEAHSDNRAFWRERTFTIPMNAETSQLFWDLLHRQEVALSLGYAFFTRGVYSNELARVDVHGVEQEVEKQIRENLKGAGVPIAATERPGGVTARLLELVRAQLTGEKVEDEKKDEGPPPRTALARSGATAIRVDAARWPELFKRVDFNEQAPPGYAVLHLYCYDFKDRLRPELLFKKVDVEATAVGGRTVELSAKFLRSQPDLYARSVRFELPVLLDRPYRYRVTTARPDGTLDEGPWTERQSWSQILDVTSRPDEVTAAPPLTKDGERE